MHFISYIFYTLVMISLVNSRRCYLCTSTLTSNCVSGVHESDPAIKIQLCQGECMKWTANDLTVKMCLPSSGYDINGEIFTATNCHTTPGCYLCDTDLCNSASKFSEVSLIVAVLVSIITMVFNL